ncbi:uncharacterized protein LACBIDRAFT_321959 [Laccaria bicolor S238N-H82]|uniref:Predicted protein n=1 Tax=Laccaria bicolor (strain S238N-H82 / ATCC MYA-4686) TaxID=486041 RepID=B0CUS2_LACBS|nr:uncharacterized protein LACBIDRAFT_321959 [Laccaria bicolor S238N-H82]EDR14144.1 predicted protein [Laccaria bicolor S238N-H82]|eukprot:XP_001874703.1 predicted protein [Laccaria bicolor S238N-H82]
MALVQSERPLLAGAHLFGPAITMDDLLRCRPSPLAPYSMKPCQVWTFLWLDSLQRRLVWIVLHVPKTLQETVYETVNSSWRPSCASISLNVDSFGYYFMSRKRSDKPFTKPSTLRGGTSVCIFVFLHLCPTLPKTFLWLDFLQRRLVWTLLHIVKTIQQTVYESINPSWRTFLWLDSLQRRFVSILLHVPKMLQQTIHESVIPSWRYTFLWLNFLQHRLIWTLLHILKMLQQTGYESVDPLWSVWKSGLVTGKRP